MADHLSTELIESIIEHAAGIDATTAARICLVNKLGRKIATPILYHTICIAAFDTDRAKDNPMIVWALRATRLQQLCQTLMDDPHLANYVKCIDHHVDFGVEDFQADVFDSAFFRQVREKILSLDPPVKPHIKATVESHEDRLDSQDVLLFFLLVICTELESIRFEGLPRSDRTRQRILDDLIFSANEVAKYSRIYYRRRVDVVEYRPDGMQNLREIRLNCAGSQGLGLHAAADMFRDIHLLSPNLEAVTIGLLDWCEDLPQEGWSLKGYPLQHLTIKSCGLDVAGLRRLFSAFTELKSLSISFNSDAEMLEEVDWARVANVFGCCTKLETLTLDYLHLDLSSRNHPVCRTSIDLSAFQHLRKLSVTAFALFGYSFSDCGQHTDRADEHDRVARLLPESLTVLEVVCENEDFTDDDLGILHIAQWLEDVTIFNCFREKWISRKHGEGTVGERAIQENKSAHLRPFFNPLMVRRHQFAQTPI